MPWNVPADRLAQLTRGDASPVIAVLDAGLDPFCALPDRVHLMGARSFVDASPTRDEHGTCAAALCALGDAFGGRWTADGWATCRVVIARVVDVRGVVQPGAVSRALAWLRTLSPRVDLVAAARPSIDIEALPQGAARRCGKAGLQLFALDQMSLADLRPVLRLVA